MVRSSKVKPDLLGSTKDLNLLSHGTNALALVFSQKKVISSISD